MKEDIKNTNIPKTYYTPNWKTRIGNAISLIKLLSKLPRKLTIAEWLETF